MSTVRQVSIIQPAANKIVSFVQQNSKAAASQLYGLPQSGPRGKIYTAAGSD